MSDRTQVGRAKYAQVGRLQQDHLALPACRRRHGELSRGAVPFAQRLDLAHDAVLAQPVAVVLAGADVGGLFGVIDNAFGAGPGAAPICTNTPLSDRESMTGTGSAWAAVSAVSTSLRREPTTTRVPSTTSAGVNTPPPNARA